MGARTSTPYKKLGAWLARVNNTVYQAATDGFVLAYKDAQSNPIRGYTDGANPPVTLRIIGSPASLVAGATMVVKKNDYWKTVEAVVVYWIPLEP